jgi:hypothetical protein
MHYGITDPLAQSLPCTEATAARESFTSARVQLRILATPSDDFTPDAQPLRLVHHVFGQKFHRTD